MQSPPPHLGLRTAIYPRSEHVANAAHADKGGGYLDKQGGGGARKAEQRKAEQHKAEQRKTGGRGVRMRTPFAAHPPPLQVRGERGVAPCACGKQEAATGGGMYKEGEARQRGRVK